MRSFNAFALLLVSVVSIEDTFNYDTTVGNEFGPSDWGQVQCDDDTCPGWPDKWEEKSRFIPQAENNTCLDCHDKEDGVCAKHNQSPIHLKRNITDRRLCHDRHRMGFMRGNCGFQESTFSIERHGLRAHQPMIQPNASSCSSQATIDFSAGFPDPWNMSFTEVKVPSEHVQDGKQYGAEVVMSHVYSKNKTDKFIGNVVVFLEAGNGTDYYDFLDLYIRGWFKAQKQVRDNCTRRQLQESSYVGLRPREATSTKETIDHQSARSLQVKRRFRRRFHPYDWLKKVDTEYYFRYEGSQTVPPCFDESVHWRVMKDPIRVAPWQIHQLEILVVNRIDPVSCVADTAGKSRNRRGTRVDVNRPIQSLTSDHKVVFCECIDWPSKKLRDQEWCNLTMQERGVVPFWKTNETTL